MDGSLSAVGWMTLNHFYNEVITISSGIYWIYTLNLDLNNNEKTKNHPEPKCEGD